VGFFGIQIGFGLQNANVSRIFQTLGAEVDSLAILWIAAPLTGLLVQPLVGHFSDRTWGRLGRRRPYFLVGAILTTLALIVMPHSPWLWMAASMLWIMDASINITMEPFRAFVGDNLPAEQRTTGYAMQSFFIGAGAVFASCLPWMLTNWFDVAATAPGRGADGGAHLLLRRRRSASGGGAVDRLHHPRIQPRADRGLRGGARRRSRPRRRPLAGRLVQGRGDLGLRRCDRHRSGRHAQSAEGGLRPRRLPRRLRPASDDHGRARRRRPLERPH